MLIGYFEPDICRQCPKLDTCRVRLKGDSGIVQASQKAVLAAQTRARLHEGAEHDKAVPKRAAIEGTNWALKRRGRASKLRVRGLARVKVVMDLKVIDHNFRQIARFFQDRVKRHASSLAGLWQSQLTLAEPQGVSVLAWRDKERSK